MQSGIYPSSTDRLNSFVAVIGDIALYCFDSTKQLGTLTLKMICWQVNDP
jgi:hypothetical protein